MAFNYNIPEFSNNLDKDFSSPNITFSAEKVYNKGIYLYDKYIIQVEGQYFVDTLDSETAVGDAEAYRKILDQYTNKLKEDKCIISNISIGANKGYGIIPYILNCECCDFNGGSEGFIDLKSEINTSYSPLDNSLQITRTIEGKGFASQFDNIEGVFSKIKATVTSLASKSFSTKPLQGANLSISSNSLSLISKKTVEDPLNASYSIVEQYSAIKDGNQFSKPIVKVSVSKQTNLETNSTITLSAQIIYREIKGSSIINTIDSLSKAKQFMEKYYQLESGYKAIDFSYKDDPFNATADVQIVYSNDDRLDENGMLQEQSLSISVDFTSASSELSYTSSLKPLYSNQNTQSPEDNTTAIMSELSIEQKDFRLVSTSYSNKQDKDYLNKEKVLTKKWNKALNMIGGNFSTGPDAYNVNINVSADLGVAQAAYTPLLEGAGAYYIENLDFATRNKINSKISALIPPEKSPPTSKLKEKLLKDGTLEVNDIIVLKDNIDTQIYYGADKQGIGEIVIEFETSSKAIDDIASIIPS